jgi:hypothetical protein
MGKINTYIHQRVNSYLCFALIGLMAFWTVLYYATHKTEAFANNYVASSIEAGY